MKWFFLVIVIVSFISCKKEKAYKLSDDICTTCNQNPIHVIGNETLWMPTVFTPNWDGINDHFIINGLEKFSNNTIVFYNRNMDQLAKYSPYLNEWTGGSVNDQTLIKPMNG
jgi:gliding motility-associated-like protein